MTRAIQTLIIGFFISVIYALPAWAEKRIALVIGNSNYSHVASLNNPRNDAEDVSTALKRLNFQVIRGVNLDKAGMDKVIRQFSIAIEDADVALFYYAGHALQVNGKNYLAPINAKLELEADLDFDMTPLSLILRQMERTKRTNLVFLDACRDNPLLKTLARSMNSTRSANLTRGLARVDTGVGTLISYSTEPGNVALDGHGRNSPFTKALLNNIETKGVSINDLMITVRKEVLKSTNGKQVPWENSSLTGQFYFNPGNTQTAALAPAQTRAPSNKQVVGVADSTIEHTFWVSIKDSNDTQQFQAYLDRYPNGVFAYLAKVKIESLSKSRTIETDDPKTVVTDKPKQTQLALANTPDDPTTTRPKITAQTPDPEQVAWQMQTQLKRVGCYLSRVDGDWGPGSIRAWSNFKRHARMRDLPPKPNAEMIALVKDFRARVCPVICERGFYKKRGKCYSRRDYASRPKTRDVRNNRDNRRDQPPSRRSQDDQKNDGVGAAIIGGLIGLGVGLSVRKK